MCKDSKYVGCNGDMLDMVISRLIYEGYTIKNTDNENIVNVFENGVHEFILQLNGDKDKLILTSSNDMMSLFFNSVDDCINTIFFVYHCKH